MHGDMVRLIASFFELKRGEMRANEMADPESLSNRSRPFFRGDGCGESSKCALSFPLEFTKTMQDNPLLERLSQAMNGRFLGFAPIFSGSPQNSCRFHLIYYHPPQGHQDAEEFSSGLFTLKPM